MHLGSLYAALASFLHARSQQGRWLLRIDDVDYLREAKGASESIIDTLQHFGLFWDGPIYYQTDQLNHYQQIIESLQNRQLIYPCNCTRKSLRALDNPIYPGICRDKSVQADTFSLRIKCSDSEVRFTDQLQGNQQHNMARQHGDFIIKRRDQITAYQLAAVIDDQQQGISHVVRGYDLLDSTPKQIYLQQILGYRSPVYCHFPVIVDSKGDKLSKQSFADAVSLKKPEKTLFFLLQLLCQQPPEKLKHASLQSMIDWGIEHWQTEVLKNVHSIPHYID